MKHEIIQIQNTGTLQLSDDDKLRIGIAWDALSKFQTCLSTGVETA
jgi:hypothetical protein